LGFIIQGLIKKKPISGYDVITYVYDRFQILLSPGTVTPTLNTLEEEGYITSFNEARKRLYTLTKNGENVINQMATAYLRCYVQLDTLSRLLLGSNLTDTTLMV